MSTSATPAEQYRKNLIRRREGAGVSVKGLKTSEGDVSVEECLRTGYWMVNCKQLVGIATTTEAGLSPDRFPVRMVLGDAPTNRSAAVMSAGYWSIVSAAGEYVLFTKRGVGNDIAMRNLFKHARDFDGAMWEIYRELSGSATRPVPELVNLFDSIYDLLIVPEVTPVQAAAIQSRVDEIMRSCRVAGSLPRFKISATLYLACVPVGDRSGTHAERTRKYAYESMLNVQVNAERLEARTDGLDSGVYTLAGHTIAAIFRYGLNEYFMGDESHTVYCAESPGGANRFVVTAISSPPGCAGPTDIHINDTFDVSGVRMSRKLSELAPGIAVIAGINHYMLNHTTGGPIASGSLLTFLSMSNVISSTSDRAEQERITTVFYEALHPVNKRAVANLFIKDSLVTTHGKDPYARPYEELDLDAFTKIRGKANPAGSHKAVICASVLSRVIDSGLAPLLPWADEITNCIEECRTVMTIGARAHIGSDYYTGENSRTQSAVLDKYLPELAAFIHNLSRGDSLSFSPHLSTTVSAAADMKWVALLKALKASDVSAVTVDTVRKYLTSVGKAFYAFDPEDETSWGQAIDASRVAKNALSTFL